MFKDDFLKFIENNQYDKIHFEIDDDNHNFIFDNKPFSSLPDYYEKNGDCYELVRMSLNNYAMYNLPDRIYLRDRHNEKVSEMSPRNKLKQLLIDHPELVNLEIDSTEINSMYLLNNIKYLDEIVQEIGIEKFINKIYVEIIGVGLEYEYIRLTNNITPDYYQHIGNKIYKFIKTSDIDYTKHGVPELCKFEWIDENEFEFVEVEE